MSAVANQPDFCDHPFVNFTVTSGLHTQTYVAGEDLYCHDYETLEEPEAAYADPCDADISHIQLEGMDVYKVRDNPAYQPRKSDFITEERVVAVERAAAQAGDNEMISDAAALHGGGDCDAARRDASHRACAGVRCSGEVATGTPESPVPVLVGTVRPAG